MAANGIKGQRRRIRRLTGDLTVRNQSQLDQRLEAVADSQRQSVSLLEEFHYRFLNLRVLECGCEKFRGTIRLVTCGKSAREHDDLRLINRFFKNPHGIADIFRCQIAEHSCNYFRSGTLKGPCAVVFTVGAGEYRDKHRRLRQLMGTDMNPVCPEQPVCDLRALLCRSDIQLIHRFNLRS